MTSCHKQVYDSLQHDSIINCQKHIFYTYLAYPTNLLHIFPRNTWKVAFKIADIIIILKVKLLYNMLGVHN